MKNLDRYCFMLLLTSYVGKLLILGANLPDALVVGILAGVNYFYHSQIQNKRIDKLEAELRMYAEEIPLMKKNLEDTRNAVAGIKLSQGLQKVR